MLAVDGVGPMSAMNLWWIDHYLQKFFSSSFCFPVGVQGLQKKGLEHCLCFSEKQLFQLFKLFQLFFRRCSEHLTNTNGQ